MMRARRPALPVTTTISIANGGFALNGTPTYAGR